ncbi:uncharacterized protein LOC116347429 [Contarinia nasturtii]|uniref:uncharacterized protein LOC116347429 n=1 Tax=Contarinia nasturtii TaxID=265458 RepID=UPI0012D3756B|nr:uncharacterized protein LOC116347429 [Contarinia nasturtii]
MNSLKSVKTHLQVLGCIPYECPLNLPIWCQKIPFNCIHIGLIFALLTQNLLSTLWFRLFEADTAGEQTQSTFFICRSTLSLILYSRLIWQKVTLTQLIAELEDVIAKRYNQFVYQMARDRVEYTKNIYVRAIFTSTIFYSSPIVLLSFYRHFSLGNNENSFQLIYPAFIPCDWRHSTGYLNIVGIQVLTLYFTTQIMLCVPLLCYIFCKFFVGFAQDIEECLIDFNKSFNKERDEDGIVRLTRSKFRILEDELGKILSFHLEARQLSDFKYILMVEK